MLFENKSPRFTGFYTKGVTVSFCSIFTTINNMYYNNIVSSLTLQELQHLPHYPSEILPLFLYLGDKRHACNAALNYDLKITSHVLLGEETAPAYPGKIESLQINIRDDPRDQLPFSEICEFLGKLIFVHNWNPNSIIIQKNAGKRVNVCLCTRNQVVVGRLQQ